MATEADVAKAQALKVRAITVDRAKDVLKVRAREKALVQKWAREYVMIKLLNEEGEEIPGCMWQVMRARLTPAFVQSRLDMSPLRNLQLDCLRDSKTQEIIYPDEMQKKCQAKTMYILIPRWPRYPMDQMNDPHYQGDYGVALFDVPLRDDSDRHDVKEEDVRQWVLFAILEEDHKGRRLTAKITQIENEMKETAKTMAQIPHMDLSDYVGDEQDRERERLYRQFEDVRNQQGEDLDKARKRWALHRERLKDTKMELCQDQMDDEGNVCNWYIRFVDKDGQEVMSDLLKKYDWGGIRLALAHKEFPTWTGRGEVPSGGKKFEKTDYSRYGTNMRGVRIGRMFHGFGTYKVTSVGGNVVSGDRFEFHHGLWRAGKKHGQGLNYSDEGIFFGTYEHDVRKGAGRLESCNADRLEGNFCYTLAHKPSRMRPNPFLKGLLHGEQGQKVTFSDGSVYEGGMKDGKITGRGRYVSSLGEVLEGEFRDGRLHGQGRFETPFDEVYEGEWCEGLLHGHGTFRGSHKESYTGTFSRGLKCGKGVERYSNGNFYRGFYRENYRYGRGAMFYGHVIDRLEPDGTHLLQYDNRMDCLWLAGYMRAGGLNYYHKSGNSFYTFPRKSIWYPFVSRLKDNEERWFQSNEQKRRRQYYMYEVVRKELEAAKVKAFVHCKQQAAKFIAKEATSSKGLRGTDVEAVYAERKGHIDHAVRRDRIDREDEGMLSLDVPEFVRRLEEVGEELGYESINATSLSQMMQLVFEGAEERFCIYSSPVTVKEHMEKAEKKADKIYQAAGTAAE